MKNIIKSKENQLPLVFVNSVGFAPKEAKPSGNYRGTRFEIKTNENRY
jgi:hypothetical protein